MKLIKLEVNNFKQFYGKQSIEFATGKNKNLTLIYGAGNSGKTAILNALRWCLYEETTSNFLYSRNLLNAEALKEGINKFSVSIQLMHDNRLLEVIRIKSRSSSNSILQIFEIVDGCYSKFSEEHPNTLINTFLPKDMSQYFLYQGEGISTLNSKNNFYDIKSAISNVLGLTIAENTVAHLNKIKIGYQKDLNQYDTDNEITNLLQDKELHQSHLQRNKALLKEKKELLSQAEEDYEKQINQLAGLDNNSIDEKIALKEKKENFLSDLKRQRFRLISEKSKSINKWVYHAYGIKLGRIDLSKVNTEDLNFSLRYTVDKKLIRSILANQEFICETTVAESSSISKIIEELEKSTVDTELKYRWSRAAKLLSKLEGFSSPKQAMAKVMSQIDDYDDSIIDIENNIKELSLTIIESDIDYINNIENKKNTAKLLYDKLINEVLHLERKINDTEVDIKHIDDKVMRLSATQLKAEKIRKLIKATDTILELYKSSISSSKKDVDLILLKKMQDFFSQVSFDGYTIKKDTNVKDASFTWTIVDKDGKRVSTGNGYQAMLSISFIVALIEFSKERVSNNQHLLTPGSIAPFVADSILSEISPDNARELVRYIADSVEQSILILSQAQWTEGSTDKGIRERVGKEYSLVQHTTLQKEDFIGQYPNKLTVQGRFFDFVRFGSEFEKVTIEEISFND